MNKHYYLDLIGVNHFSQASTADQIDDQSNDVLNELKITTEDCNKCELASQRKNIVFSSGAINAGLMIVGSPPNQEEDLSGTPFSGAQGALLEKMLLAIDMSIQDVYITNITKCSFGSKKIPTDIEIGNCNEYLMKQIELVKPRLILTLGILSAQALLRSKKPLDELRVQENCRVGSTPIVVSYHPIELAEDSENKRKAWEDLKKVKAFLVEQPSG